jgi:hypothetical protein
MSEGQTERSQPDEAPIALPPLLVSGPPRREPPSRTAPVLWLALLLAVVLALVGTAPFWAPAIASILPWAPETRPAIMALQGPPTEALDQRLGAVEQKLDKAAQSPAHDGEAAAAIARQQAALQTLADRLKALEDKPPPAPVDTSASTTALAQIEGELDRLDDANHKLAAALNDANERIEQLEKAQDGAHAADDDRLLLVALGELRGAVAGSGPYASALGTVEALARAKPDLAARLKPLEADAAAGVPSVPVLSQHFSQAVPAILRAGAATAPADAGFGERLWTRLKSLVVVRRLDAGRGDAPADPVDRALASAEAALGKGDLAGAVDAVGKLEGPPAQAAAPWLAEARRRLAAETLLAGVTQEVAGSLPADAAAATGTDAGSGAPAPAPKPQDAHE